MKQSKPIVLFIPAAFIDQLNKYLEENPPTIKVKMIYFYYLINYFAYKHANTKKHEYLHLNLKYLSSLLVYNLSSYIEILQNGEFINQGLVKYKGQIKKGYKLNNLFSGKLVTIEIEPGTKLFNKLIKRQRNKKAHHSRLKPHLNQMKNLLMNVDFDYNNAEQYLIETDNGKSFHSLVALQRFKDKRFRNFHRNNTNNRLDTNLTTLKNELMQFIVGDYVSIDLKNSQPFLLGVQIFKVFIDLFIEIDNNLIEYHIKGKKQFFDLIQTFGIKAIERVSKINQKTKKGDLVNLSLFNQSVLNGTFYDDFIKYFDGDITRKEIKDIMFKVMFSRNVAYNNYRKTIPYWKEKKIFKSVYPVAFEIIEILKEKNHSDLAVYLQKSESYLFIDIICKRLVENDIIPITKHDSVIVKASQQAETLKIVKSVFMEQFGVTPAFHIEPLKKKI